MMGRTGSISSHRGRSASRVDQGPDAFAGYIRAVAEDAETRRKIAKELRLYGLSFSCAVPGAVAVSVSGRLVTGIFVFLLCLLVFGPLLLWYEKRHRR